MKWWTTSQDVKARKAHFCTSCGELILSGSLYKKWASFNDGGAFTNKMHPECLAAHMVDADVDGGVFEYTPYSYPRGSVE